MHKHRHTSHTNTQTWLSLSLSLSALLHPYVSLFPSCHIPQVASAICIETFKENAPMGRFSLRDEGKTMAVGKVLKLVSMADSAAEAKAAAVAAAEQ